MLSLSLRSEASWEQAEHPQLRAPSSFEKHVMATAGAQINCEDPLPLPLPPQEGRNWWCQNHVTDVSEHLPPS